MIDEADDIHLRSAEAARHVEYTPYVHPEIDRLHHARIEIGLEPFPKEARQTPYGEQNENGTDLSLIRSQMRKSPTERVRIADRTTAGTLWMMRNVQRSRQRTA